MTRAEAMSYIIPAIERTWNDKICKQIKEVLNEQHCEDAISRQAALNAMNELPHEYRNKEQRARTGGIAACKMIVEELPSVSTEKAGRWIPVSERLPEDFQRVLVTVVNYKGDKVVRVAEYNNWKGVFKIKENNEQWEVGEKGLIAWMPLPQPYKGESEE